MKKKKEKNDCATFVRGYERGREREREREREKQRRRRRRDLHKTKTSYSALRFSSSPILACQFQDPSCDETQCRNSNLPQKINNYYYYYYYYYFEIILNLLVCS